MKEEKITTTIRIPDDIIKEMQEESRAMGISLNSYMLVAMSQGRKVLNSDISLHGSLQDISK